MSIKKLWPPIIWALFILLLTGIPGNYVPETISFLDWASPDKVVHFILFGGQTFLILFAFRDKLSDKKNRRKVIITAITLGVAYGLLTEILQAYVFIGRDGNLFDFVADFLGAILGFLAFYLLYLKKTNRNYVDKD